MPRARAQNVNTLSNPLETMTGNASEPFVHYALLKTRYTCSYVRGDRRPVTYHVNRPARVCIMPRYLWIGLGINLREGRGEETSTRGRRYRDAINATVK